MLQLPRALRVLFVLITFLLSANAAVVVTRLGGDVAPTPDAPVAASDASPAAGSDDTLLRDVVIITGADGQQIAVDPSTPEGQAAIQDAVARGDVVETRTVAIQAPRADGTGGDDPAATAGAPLSQSVLDAALRGVSGAAVAGAPTGPGAPGGGGAGGSTTVPGTPLDDVIQDATNTVNSVVEDTRRTVNDAIQDVADTVNDITDGTTVSVPGVPVTVTTPPVTVTLPPVTVTTPPVTVSVPVVPVTVTVPPVTVAVTVPPVTVAVTVPPVTVPPLTVPTTVPCLVLC